jgi:ribosomal protein L11 methyltransferase
MAVSNMANPGPGMGAKVAWPLRQGIGESCEPASFAVGAPAPGALVISRWYEIALPIEAGLVDEAAALLDFAGFGGVEIRDRGDECDVVVVVETGDDESEVESRAGEAHDAIAILHAGPPKVAELDSKVWTENWKKHFARRTFAGRIEVRPPWEEAGETLSIVINPGMAFGTGLHETTAGCLELLVEEVKPGNRIADVGCGSGILAIAAAKLGAAEVLATDVDPLAIEATRENIEANGVGSVVRVELEPGEVGVPEWENDARPGLTRDREREGAFGPSRTSDSGENADAPNASTHRDANVDRTTLELVTSERGTPNGADSGGFAACAPASFDLVVANILAETLIEMCQSLTSAVRPGGTLVLSGIEARRLKSVEEAFIRHPWRRERIITRGDWVSLSLHHDALAEPDRKAS